MDRVRNTFPRYFFCKRRDLPSHCDLSCSRPPDSKRHMGRVIIKGRQFCWFCCPSYECCQIWEIPEAEVSSEWEACRQIAALEILSQILKGQRPWKDLEEVVRLMPEHY